MDTQRYPISVGLIGVMQKEESKMYMNSVLWSDQNEIIVYRSLKDFKKMHKRLKKAFPGWKKSDRIIPKFQDKMVNMSIQKKGPNKSLERLKFLQKYCNELLSCDPRVTQHADLFQFFHPNDQDLQPEFAKNSIMIMPTDNEIGNAVEGSGGKVIQPFVTETYRCVATYDTKDTKNKPFKVAVDEKVEVLIKDKAGWWLVENEDKRMAWFPAPYLEKLHDDDDEDEDEKDGASERGMLYIAVKSYKATKDDEISVAIGAVVEVLQKSDNGWWLIRYSGKAGYIPTMYLQLYNNPHMRMPAHHDYRRASSPIIQSDQLSLSHGNLLHPSPVRSSTPSQHQPNRKPRSYSIDIMSEQLPVRPASSHAYKPASILTSRTTGKLTPPPTNMVEIYREERRRAMSPGADSEESNVSDSSGSSDDLNSSWASSSSFNLSQSYNEEQMRLSRTPPPTLNNYLSPTSPQGKMIPSVSDLNLTTPKVPPRPHAQEILTRCSSITRKNASRGRLSPSQTEIMS
ncbi:NADPH oxidase organizer 1-like [Sebastes fasciatus]|uniref:NADPH oxidase organizer 1-like n=1 Tax=Sebastes fasciatus TaxID=394691 RepID=UPI003D9E536F